MRSCHTLPCTCGELTTAWVFLCLSYPVQHFRNSALGQRIGDLPSLLLLPHSPPPFPPAESHFSRAPWAVEAPTESVGLPFSVFVCVCTLTVFSAQAPSSFSRLCCVFSSSYRVVPSVSLFRFFFLPLRGTERLLINTLKPAATCSVKENKEVLLNSWTGSERRVCVCEFFGRSFSSTSLRRCSRLFFRLQCASPLLALARQYLSPHPSRYCRRPPHSTAHSLVLPSRPHRCVPPRQGRVLRSTPRIVSGCSAPLNALLFLL